MDCIYQLKSDRMKIITAFTTVVILFVSCHVGRKPQNPITESNPKEGGGNEFIMGKINRGVDFYAIGNEPGWSLEMDIENGMQFKTSDGIIFNTPPVSALQTANVDETRYNARVEAGELDIRIISGECTDNMSGEKFPHKVIARLKRGNEKEFTTFEGCGRWIFDQRLHDIWALEQINGKPITITEGRNQRPYLEFHTGDRRVMGNTGCNELSGEADYRGNKIIFKELAVTLKACMDASFETDLLKIMAPGEVEFKIDGGRLYLNRAGAPGMVFRKVD